jgi:hypothetical protein
MYQKFRSFIPGRPRELLSKRGLIFCLVFMLVSFGFLYGIRTQAAHMRSGDEPHYLLMDYSFVKDHDFDLKNNYQNQDGLRYYPVPLEPHVSPRNLNNSSSGWYSYHGIGLPLFLLPGFLIDEGRGPIIMMVLVASAVLFLTWLWALKITQRPVASLLATGCLAICFFFNGLAGYLYPDMLLAGLLLLALLVVYFYRDRIWGQVVFGATLGVMVVVHPKSLSIVLPLLILMAYLTYKSQKKLPWVVLVSGAPFAILFVITLYKWFGTLNPLGIYPTYLGVISPLKSIPASLLGSQRGLFVYNPILLLMLSGLVIWYRRDKKRLLQVLMVIAPSYFITMLFSEWFGGYAPVGRYLIDLLPVLIPSLAFVFAACKRPLFYVLCIGLAVLTAVVTLIATFLPIGYPREQYRSEFFIVLQQRVGIAFDKVLPHYSLSKSDLTGDLAWFKVLLCLMIMAAFVYLGFALSRIPRRHTRS